MSGSMILYLDAYWSNTWDCAPYVALREKGLAFSTVLAMVNNTVTAPIRYQAITGLEPALQHGDFWVAESYAIIEYLEDAFPPPAFPPLFPQDLHARARARQLMSWTRMELTDLRRERTSTLLFYPRDEHPPLGPHAAAQAAKLCAMIERLAPSPTGALFGDWCIADVDVAFALMRLVKTGYPVPDSVRAYAEAVWQRPSVREYVEHPRPPHAPH
ncbi:MAG: glutathione transferase [Kofleriaceae bacterium]